MPPIEKKKKFLFLFLNQSSALALRSSQSESIEYSRRKIKKSMRLVCVAMLAETALSQVHRGRGFLQH